MDESGTPSFSMVGLLMFTTSCATEAARVIYSQLLLGPEKFNTAEVLVYVSAPCAALLLGSSFLFEWQGVVALGPKLLADSPLSFLMPFVISFFVNLSSYYAIATTSSLTFKVAGCLKNVGVVWYGAAVHAEHVSVVQMLGYLISVSGFILYSTHQMNQGPRRAKGSVVAKQGSETVAGAKAEGKAE